MTDIHVVHINVSILILIPCPPHALRNYFDLCSLNDVIRFDGDGVLSYSQNRYCQKRITRDVTTT